ncbi:retrovirus-related pol polyprotein from transposon TNT 1-94 [Tanacetum coccineum]
MVAFLEKSTGSEGFHQVIDFLNRSHICYALTKKPDVYISFIKQFWRSAEATNDDNGEVQLTATIDGHSMTITEASLRRHLKLDDHDNSDKLTFQKGAFSPQWRFLIHTILHCLSPKKTAWEQFSSNIAICQFKFDLYMQRKQLQQHSRTYRVPSLSIKVFNNMKRPTKGYSGQEVALFPTMLNISEPSTSPLGITSSPSHSPEPSIEHSHDHTTVDVSFPSPTQPSPGAEQYIPTPNESPLHVVHSHGSAKGSLKLNELTTLVTKLSEKIGVLEDDLKKTKQTYSAAVTKLILRVKKLETKLKAGTARKRAWVVLSEDVEDDSSKQGRKVSDADSEKGSSEVSTAGATKGTASEVPVVSTAEGNPMQKEYKEKGVIDSSCSRHMTRNKCYLTEYEDYDGGFVSFGDGKGRISRKVPRKDNIYSVDLKSVVPTKGLTCLFAKAIIDESNLWHRRLGHINFKNMNKLVRGNLNGVAERRNRTLIEAARTMLVDSKLPTTFWAKAVNTACYVLNKVLVIKPHNKTPYELIHGRTPLIDFMKPFGCPVTILNTRDHLGKFDGKANEGFFVGYSVVSKAMRVFNKRTRIVEETLNIRFLKNTPNVIGNGLDWLFDVDSLTIFMNYVPVVTGNQTNGIAGTRDNIVSEDDAEEKPTKMDKSGASDKDGEDDQATRSEFERLLQQEKQTKNPNSTNSINTVSTPVSTAGPSCTDDDTSSLVNTAEAFNAFEENLFERFSPFKNAFTLPPISNVTPMDDTGIFGNAYDDEDVGAKADLNNLETTLNVSPIPTTRIDKDHPKDQIIGDFNSAI